MAKVSTPLNGGQRVGRAYMGGHSMDGPSTPPVAHVGTRKNHRWCHGGWHTAFAGSRTRREVSGVRAAAAHCPIGADVHCSVYRDW